VFGSVGVPSSPSLVRGNRMLRNFLHKGLMQSSAGANSFRISLNPSVCILPCLPSAISAALLPYHFPKTFLLGRSLVLHWNPLSTRGERTSIIVNRKRIPGHSCLLNSLTPVSAAPTLTTAPLPPRHSLLPRRRPLLLTTYA
jgi:hypothetical protein